MKLTGLDLPISGWFDITVSFTSQFSNEISDIKTLTFEVPESGKYDIDFDMGEVARSNQLSFEFEDEF